MNATKSSAIQQVDAPAGSPRHRARANHVVGAATAASGGEAAEADQPPEPAARIEIDDARAAGFADAVDRTWIADQLRKAIAEMNSAHVARVTVRLLDEAQMKTLHHRAFGDAVVTDVISFDASENSQTIEADIAVCVDVAARESIRREHSLERELLLYALHGLLHCCGYDDHEDAAYEAMHAEEDRILAAIGVGATFDAGNESGMPGNKI